MRHLTQTMSIVKVPLLPTAYWVPIQVYHWSAADYKIIGPRVLSM